MKCDSQDIDLCDGKLHHFRFRNVYRCERHIKFWCAWADVPLSLGYTRESFKAWLEGLAEAEVAGILRRRLSGDWEEVRL